MRKLSSLLLLVCGSMIAQQKNPLLTGDFWKQNPDIALVQTEIEKGNDPSQLDLNAFDPVVMAINNGASNEVVKYLLTQKGNDKKDKITHDGRTYLHWAAYKGNLEIVDLLISKGYDINLKDEKGATPLEFAAGSGLSNVAVYDRFFKAGIDAKKKYTNGASILLIGMPSMKDLSVADYLVSKGLSLTETDAGGATAFDYAARNGNLANLKALVAKGVRPTSQALIFAGQGARRSSNPIEVFTYLIDDLKLDPKVTTKDGETVLHLIARKPNQEAIVKYFIDKGVDMTKTDHRGNTPLMLASSAKDLNVVKLLSAKIKDINAKNAKGESALTQAVRGSSPEVMAYLMEKSADAKVINKDGSNLAYYLIESYRPGAEAEFSQKLAMLQNKMDITAPQNDGNTLYHLAIAKNDIGLLKKIALLNVDINKQNKEGLTALHKAALLAKDDSIMKYLISSGAKLDLKTEFDETAYQLATENEYLAKNNISIDFLKHS